MTIKKSLIAMAVAGAVGAPLSAAQAAEVYGTLNLNVDSTSFDDGEDGAASADFTDGNIIFAGGHNDSGLFMNDTQQSRFGVKGDEDLGNGLTAMYRLELGLGTGANNEDGGIDKRLGWVGLSGGFGQVKVGNMWGVIYSYSGWNTWTTCCNGGAAYYYTTGTLNDDAFGLRVDNAIQYTYGAGGYGSDPFTFTVEAGMQDNGTGDEETIDHLSIGGQATFGDFTVNAFNYSENNTQPTGGSTPEPSLTGIGGRWASGPIRVGVNYHMLDLDLATNNREPSSIMAMVDFDVGGGLNFQGGIGSGDADSTSGAGDLTSFFFRADQDLSSRTELYAEYESATTDDTAVHATSGAVIDGETSVVSAGIRHSF